MTPEQEAAEFTTYAAWKNAEWDATHSHAGIGASSAWMARAEIAAADKARIAELEAEVQALRVSVQRLLREVDKGTFGFPFTVVHPATVSELRAAIAARAAGGEG